MKTHFLLTTVAAVLLFSLSPTAAYAQCDASIGDTGIVGGSFIDQGANSFGGNADAGFFGGGSLNADCGPNGACASGCGGPYMTVIGGYVDMQEQTVGNQELEYEDGFAIGGALGYRVNKFLRVEAEYIYRENDFAGNAIAGPAIPTSEVGQLLSHTGMLNGYLDLPIGAGRIVPYVGAGAGVSGIDSELGQFGDFGFTDFTVIDFDSTFAFQWMAGVSIRAFPNAEFFAEYRYFEANDPQFEFTNSFGGSSVVDAEYANRNVFIGVRMNF